MFNENAFIRLVGLLSFARLSCGWIGIDHRTIILSCLLLLIPCTTSQPTYAAAQQPNSGLLGVWSGVVTTIEKDDSRDFRKEIGLQLLIQETDEGQVAVSLKERTYFTTTHALEISSLDENSFVARLPEQFQRFLPLTVSGQLDSTNQMLVVSFEDSERSPVRGVGDHPCAGITEPSPSDGLERDVRHPRVADDVL